MTRGVDEIDRQLNALRERMNRLFDESMASARLAGGATWLPPADLYRIGDRMVLTLELPGVEPEEVVVEEAGAGVLRVRGRRPVAAEGAAALQLERSYGPFQRDFELPKGVDATAPDVKFEDGILRIELAIRSGAAGAR